MKQKVKLSKPQKEMLSEISQGDYNERIVMGGYSTMYSLDAKGLIAPLYYHDKARSLTPAGRAWLATDALPEPGMS